MNKWLEIINKRKVNFGKQNLILNSNAEETAATIEVDEKYIKSLIKCPRCNNMLDDLKLHENNKVCYCCNYNFRMDSNERMKLIFDEGSIEFFDENIVSCNPIGFPSYDEKIEQLKERLEINEAVITGKGNILNQQIYFGVMDYRFIMGSMGSVVGEKLTRMIERATKENKPIIIFSASGGARMQEGILSLYQMAKVVAAIDKHSKKRLLYISVLTDPTTGGVSASFASIADIIIAEPNATIGFAGKRVIKNTVKEKNPDHFQTAEFHFKNGHIDVICDRKNIKNMVSDIISLYDVKLLNNINEFNYELMKIENMDNSIYSNVSAWEKVKLARHPNRPNFQDYVDNIFDNFIELHGDRISKDDKAIITGIGTVNGIPVTAILNAKGKNIDENRFRNFGMAGPEGYRKVARIAKLSEKFGLPILCFIDTPGAFCGAEAERMGQSEAIANCIRMFTSLSVPIISVITGEGCSGGALATGVADWIFILENSIYSVISPEGCASILFKDATKADETAEFLKLTAKELLKLNVVDEVIIEPKDGIHTGIEVSASYIRNKIYIKLIDLLKEDVEYLMIMRSEKFRNYGVYGVL